MTKPSTDKPNHHWQQGCVQVYTGKGKGKTTAAVGLALRAAGAGLSVYIAQFTKGTRSSELDALAERFSDLITVEQFGGPDFVKRRPTSADIAAAHEGFTRARQALTSCRYRVVILDEANIATHLNLFSADDLLTLIDAKPDNVELIITGRYADEKIIARADLVTEMREVKHYFQTGLSARRGIDR